MRPRTALTTGSGAGSAKKPAGKKRSRSAPKKQDGDALTQADLYKKATAANIPGRSQMTRDDLIDALKHAS
ncbi:Rho termination factor N-terminal domain-containing protein [Streptomyces xanthophaeus]